MRAGVPRSAGETKFWDDRNADGVDGGVEPPQPRSFANACHDDDDGNATCQLKWHDALYYIVTTLTTVGRP